MLSEQKIGNEPMSDFPEQIVNLLEKSATAILELTAQLSAESAARMAHRHILSSMLADRHDLDVKSLLNQLHEFIDGVEHADGPVWASAYREELDLIYQDTVDAKSFEK